MEPPPPQAPKDPAAPSAVSTAHEMAIGRARLFVFCLPPEATFLTVFDAFAPFGRIMRYFVAEEAGGQSTKKYGFVEYQKEADALRALQTLNATQLLGQTVYIRPCNPVSKSDPVESVLIKQGGIYIPKLDPSITAEQLYRAFRRFGEIDRCIVNTVSEKHEAFITFSSEESALYALNYGNGLVLDTSRIVLLRDFCPSPSHTKFRIRSLLPCYKGIYCAEVTCPYKHISARSALLDRKLMTPSSSTSAVQMTVPSTWVAAASHHTTVNSMLLNSAASASFHPAPPAQPPQPPPAPQPSLLSRLQWIAQLGRRALMGLKR